jgi:TfoX/Sxy family transcriptional regulator of competence genes
MAYDKILAQRIFEHLEGREYIWKKMFGGICFLFKGNMGFGILDENLIVRVGPENYNKMLSLPDTGVFDITGRIMKGWVLVKAEGIKSNKDLKAWLKRGITYALTLPAK